jgi:AraC-like DNA-binding protein
MSQMSQARWPSRELVDSNVDTSYLACLRCVAQPLIQFTSGQFPPGAVSTPHHHPCIVLHGCLNGPIDFIVGNVRHTLDAGHFFLLPPGITHHWRSRGDRTASTMGLLVDADNPGRWSASSGVPSSCRQLARLLTEPKFFDANVDTELRSAFWIAADMLMLDQPRNDAAVNGVLWLILGLAIDRLEPKTAETEEWNESARRIRRLLLSRVAEPLSVEEIASEVHMSLTQAKKVFTATYGCGIKTYFNELKLYHAKRLLGDLNLNVAQVGMKLGFSSPSYFCRMFRGKTGQSPSDYRDQLFGKKP